MKPVCLFAAIFALASSAALAQTTQIVTGDSGQGPNLMGRVTASTKDSLTIAPLAGGAPVTAKISDQTGVFKNRQPAKLEDIKPDDVVAVLGELKGNIMQADRVIVVNPQVVQQFMGPGGGPRFNREDLGKKFIAGEVKAINETKLTIARPDNQNQDIEVDENTSFKKGSESITFPEIKAGDFVHGPGEMKDGVFVAKELMVGRPQMPMMIKGPGGQPQEVKPGETPQAAPSPSPQTHN